MIRVSKIVTRLIVDIAFDLVSQLFHKIRVESNSNAELDIYT